MDALLARLTQFQQAHLLAFWNQLSQEQRGILTDQIESIPWDELERCIRGDDNTVDWKGLAAQAEPPPAIRLGRQHPSITHADALRAGEAALRSGKLGMILVAGGQGTRLGFDLPKGMFKIGPLSHRSLFAMHVDRLRAVMKRYRVSIPLFIMTSPATDQATREFFQEHNRFGLAEDELIIFCQGTMPAIDQTTGKVLLSRHHEVAISPDGHGGLIAALHRNACLKFAQERGIEHFFYAQVDNPLVELCDPLLVGYHLLAKSEMTTQVVRKRFAKEKVGNVVSLNGKVAIIEYSDLPDSIAERVNEDGSLKLWAGNIAVHVFDSAFLDRIATSDSGLPFHRAIKAVPFVNEVGELISPKAPNAIKFERFVFDLLPLAQNAIVVEGDARRVFAPVKNADGAETDTPSTCREALMQLHASWLREAGVTIADGVRVEIDPSWALDEAEVRAKLSSGLHLSTDTYFCA